MKLKFNKYQGLGNDFILLDKKELPSGFAPSVELIKSLCERRYGIGADGVLMFSVVDHITLDEPQEEFRMIYYNSDGSKAETCFNGLRCIGLHAVRNRHVEALKPFNIRHDAGLIRTIVSEDSDEVETQLNFQPTLDPEIIGLNLSQPLLEDKICLPSLDLAGTAISMGNPHFISWAETNDFNTLNRFIDEHGSDIEKNHVFKAGTNFEYAALTGKNQIRMAVWERGSGRTLACGSGAAAVVIAAIITGRVETDNQVKVEMPGGELYIKADVSLLNNGEINLNGEIIIQGEAKHVFSGYIEIRETM